MRIFGRGLALGLGLQVAIGPVCLFVFNQSLSAGFLNAWAAAWGAVLADTLFILAAVFGLANLLATSYIRTLLTYLSALVLSAFGIYLIWNAWSTTPVAPLTATTLGEAFSFTLFLTLSNPLAIVFWTGIFALRVAEGKLSSRELPQFALGALSATLLFLTGVAGLGTASQRFLSPNVIRGLNSLVGIGIIFLGLRPLFRLNTRQR